MADTKTDRKATIHVIHQRAKHYVIGSQIELNSGGYVTTGRVLAVREHNPLTDLCLVDLEDAETMTVAQYMARKKRAESR